MARSHQQWPSCAMHYISILLWVFFFFLLLRYLRICETPAVCGYRFCGCCCDCRINWLISLRDVCIAYVCAFTRKQHIFQRCVVARYSIYTVHTIIYHFFTRSPTTKENWCQKDEGIFVRQHRRISNVCNMFNTHFSILFDRSSRTYNATRCCISYLFGIVCSVL